MEAEFYLDFENNFRGSRNQIRDILSNYDGLIQYVLDTDDHPRLLDIGSGRGEWLQKCSDLGFESIGIEINSDMAEFCENIGLNILRGDAISLLKDIPDNSFSLISAFHIIEHIDFDSIKYNSNGLLSVISKLTEINPDDQEIIYTDTFLMAIDCEKRLYSKLPIKGEIKQIKNLELCS